LPGDLLAAYDHAVTGKELAPVLGISQQRVFSRAAAGSLPCFHIGGAVRFCPATIVTTLALPTTYTVALLTIVDRLAGFGHAMNVEEVAYILGVGVDLIYRQSEAGNLPSFPIGTRLVFYQATMARYITSISGGAK
jgi:predicted DNA-binding transcriptional regulator AlpA